MRLERGFMYCAAVAGTLIAVHATAESWNYQTYYMGQPAAIGYISLEQKDGDNLFRIVAPRLDPCWQREMKALVERKESTIVISPLAAVGYCESEVEGTRFVINADGSGGVRQVKKGSDWVSEGTKRDLTIRK